MGVRELYGEIQGASVAVGSLDESSPAVRRTQCDKILDYILAGGVITHFIAEELFGCTRLAARIRDLRCMGYKIVTTMQRSLSGKRYAAYSMPREG